MATSTASSGAFYEGTIEGENGNPIAVFADHIKDVRTSVLPSVTSNSVARDYVAAKLNEFSFLVVGPPRVGKSTLINAMLNGHVADTSGGMAACTSQVRCFDRTISYADAQPVTLHFTDSPGIEDWPRAQATVTQYLSAANPVCVFFCFAPARFAQISEFVPIIQKLVDAHVFVALVLTNMYTGGLTEIKDTWNQMVSLAAPLGAFQSSTRDGYGMEVIRRYEKGLCMQVNSIEYNGPRGVTYPANINTFITELASLMDAKQLEGLLHAILNNRTFWQKVDHTFRDLILTKFPAFARKVLESAADTGLKLAEHFMKWLLLP